jgi:beta-glucanase (GH16 family)
MNNRAKLYAVFLSLIVLSIGCDKNDTQVLEPRNWSLVWADEFEGDSLTSPDSLKWTYELGNGEGGWGNKELQSYTNEPQNVSLDGKGNLVLRTIKNGNNFTSARIKTQGLFKQQYGRFEARLKTPYGPGLWPAFWMLGDNISDVSWPKCGEIDVMELRGQAPNIVNGTLHGPGYSGGNSITKGYALTNERFDTKYHVFAIEWDANKIDFFIDDFLYQRIKKEDVPGTWVYDQPFYMILNVAVGGNYVGFPTSETIFPQTMTVDYVRVFKTSN